jgi:hypothetical protein
MEKFLVAVVGGLMVFVLLVVLAFVFAVVTMWAWNNSVAEIFHISEIGFMQAWWLNVLSGVLFKCAVSTGK